MSAKGRLSVLDIKNAIALHHVCEIEDVQLVVETQVGAAPVLYAIVPWYEGLGPSRRFPAAAPKPAEKSAQKPSPEAHNPPCSECGSLTTRAGSCYLCSNCGSTSGCG